MPRRRQRVSERVRAGDVQWTGGHVELCARGVPCGAFDSSPGVMAGGGFFVEFELFRMTRSPRGPERGIEQSSRVAAMASGAYAIDARRLQERRPFGPRSICETPRRHALPHGPRLPRLVSNISRIMPRGLRLQRARPKPAGAHVPRGLFLFRRHFNVGPRGPNNTQTPALPAGHVLLGRRGPQPHDALDPGRTGRRVRSPEMY